MKVDYYWNKETGKETDHDKEGNIPQIIKHIQNKNMSKERTDARRLQGWIRESRDMDFLVLLS